MKEIELFQMLLSPVPSNGITPLLGAARTWKTWAGQNWGLELQKLPKPTQPSDTCSETRPVLLYSPAGSWIWSDNSNKRSPSQEQSVPTLHAPKQFHMISGPSLLHKQHSNHEEYKVQY